jgi:hypothetical protein
MAEAKAFTNELTALAATLNALEPLGDEARRFVLRTAIDRLDVRDVSVASQTNSQDPFAKAKTGSNGVEAEKSPKEFLRAKKATSELQRLVCLASYLTDARKQLHFTTKDLTALNIEAAGGKLSNASATIRNGTSQSGFFASAGKGGLKQLTPLGEDVAKALPDQDRMKAVVEEHRVSKRKKRKRKTAK